MSKMMGSNPYLSLSFFPYHSCIDTRYPEPHPDGVAGQAQLKQATICRGPFPTVAEEEVCVLLHPQSWPHTTWREGG